MNAGKQPRILGIGCAVPTQVVTNDDLTKLFDTSDEWIYTRTGIKERHLFTDDREAFDLLKKAAIQALNNAELKPEDMDLIIAATSMPVQFMPSTSCVLQELLEIERNVPAFDISVACSGFVYGLDVASAYIQSGKYKNVLLVTIDNCSRYVDWTDRRTSILFGDGIGAAVISAGGVSDIDVINIKANGHIGEYIHMPAQNGNSPFSTQKPQQQFCNMAGQEVYKFAVSLVPPYIADEILAQNNILPEDVDYLIPHQANQRIVKAIQDRLGYDDSKVISNIEHFGNTSASSILIALCDGLASGKIKTPSRAIVCGFGAGMCWGGGVIRLNDGIFKQENMFQKII